MSHELRRKMLNDAAEIVTRDRATTYGEAEDSFRTIANLWNAYLQGKADPELGPEDVALMMALLKIARLINNPGHYDSAVDLAGYAACLTDVAHRFDPPTAPVDSDPAAPTL